jgi:hypothetical protein
MYIRKKSEKMLGGRFVRDRPDTERRKISIEVHKQRTPLAVVPLVILFGLNFDVYLVIFFFIC